MNAFDSRTLTSCRSLQAQHPLTQDILERLSKPWLQQCTGTAEQGSPNPCTQVIRSPINASSGNARFHPPLCYYVALITVAFPCCCVCYISTCLIIVDITMHRGRFESECFQILDGANKYRCRLLFICCNHRTSEPLYCLPTRDFLCGTRVIAHAGKHMMCM